MLEEQGGVCAICKRPERPVGGKEPKRLSVDHDHDTGQVRGLLCKWCNSGLQYLENDSDWVEKSTTYLRRSVTT